MTTDSRNPEGGDYHPDHWGPARRCVLCSGNAAYAGITDYPDVPESVQIKRETPAGPVCFQCAEALYEAEDDRNPGECGWCGDTERRVRRFVHYTGGVGGGRVQSFTVHLCGDCSRVRT